MQPIGNIRSVVSLDPHRESERATEGESESEPASEEARDLPCEAGVSTFGPRRQILQSL